MDDKRIDDVFKAKLYHYEDPVYDMNAASAFDEKLSMLATRPWYSKYRTAALVAASLALFTLFNYLIINKLYGDSENLRNEIAADYKAEINKLHDDINQLRSLKTDTIYMRHKDISSLTPSSFPDQISKAEMLRILDNEEWIVLLLERLTAKSLDVRMASYYQRHGNAIPLVARLTGIPIHNDFDSESNVTPPQLPENWETDSANANLKLNEKVKPSSKVIKDLKKHYSNGVGIKAGGELAFVMSSPGTGSTGNAVRGGVLGELVFSPGVALETGLKYSSRVHTINKNEIDVSTYPGIDESLGEFKDLEIKSRILEVPVNVKYYHHFDQDKQLYLTLGLSPNIFLSQNFKYRYSVDLNNSGNTESSEGEVVLTSDQSFEKIKWDPGTINAGVGISYDLPGNKILQVGAFYQKSMNGLGREGVKQNLFGLKSSLWFRVR